MDIALQPERLNQTVTVSALEDTLTVPTSIGTHLGLDQLHTPADLAIVSSETLSTRVMSRSKKPCEACLARRRELSC